MTATANDPAPSSIDAVLERLFLSRQAPLVTVPILQPADPYLDAAGEAFRRRIFLTRGEGGEALCLRPDFTIPVCLSHLEASRDLPRRYSYLGLVFRQHRTGSAEFRQAGIEDLGDPRMGLADARALRDAIDSLGACGLPVAVPDAGFQILFGDQGLFEAFLSALGLPEGWQRRLVRTFGNDDLLARALDDLARHDGRALAGLDPEWRRLAAAGEASEIARRVHDGMERAGLSVHAGRTPAEIAARLIEKVEVAQASLPDAALQLLRRFLAIDCPLSQAAAALGTVADEAGLDLGAGLAVFEARNLALQGVGVDLSSIAYRAAFGRTIDYYTGMVFEIRAAGEGEPLAGGGRFDRLLNLLGARERVPAVGFSLWLDRIEAQRSAGSRDAQTKKGSA